MLSADEVDYLVQATNSSVKRFGGAGPTLSHLAYVLSTKWSSEFVRVFGDRGSDDVKLLLQRDTFIGEESEVRRLLAGCQDQKSLLIELHTRLRGPIEEANSALAESAAPVDDPGSSERLASATGPSAATSSGPEWPERTRRFLTPVEVRDDLLERDEAIIQAATILLRTRRRIPLILGARGSGRTTLLGGLVSALEPIPVWRVCPERVGPEPEGPLARIIDDCAEPTVLVLDDFDQMASLGTPHPNVAMLRLVTSAALHPDLRIVLVCEARFSRRLEIHAENLVELTTAVRLPALSDTAVEEVVQRVQTSIETSHGVTIAKALRSVACLPARQTDGAVHPGLALDRLDAAASRARVLGRNQADVVHLAGFASKGSRAMQPEEIKDQLGRRVHGQPRAIDAVATRLSLTLSRLDLRPERPDGVFLFVGPTGVGKTELARAIGASLFCGEDRLIRLDMSEYAHDWAVSRIVGPMPGYVGSTEPETWLTTKVAQMPESVVLLDEIEKAHPTVWNTFLQVFDSGRLTDSRGTTADFSSTVIVMTSNLGAAAASAPTLGFGSQDADIERSRERITRAVKEAMPPELVNRIDELVVFDPLSIGAIADIAEIELARVCERLAELGRVITYDGDVVTHLVSSGYDPAYGARHLQRNIERLFIGLVARSQGRSLHVVVSDGELVAQIVDSN